MGKRTKLAEAMRVGLDRHRHTSEVKKRKRLLKRFLKTDRGQELAAQMTASNEAGEQSVMSLSEDNKAVEITRTLTPAENSSEDSENESKITEEDEGAVE